MVECAIREAAEETGLQLRNTPGSPACSLAQPEPFTAADVIVRDSTGRIQYHYAIVEVLSQKISKWKTSRACILTATALLVLQVAATPEDPRQTPRAAADADDIQMDSSSRA